MDKQELINMHCKAIASVDRDVLNKIFENNEDDYAITYYSNGSESLDEYMEKVAKGSLRELVGVSTFIKISGDERCACELDIAKVKIPSLHSNENYMLQCLDLLLDYDDADAYNTVLPFAHRRWNQGYMSFKRCPFKDKVPHALSHLEKNGYEIVDTPILYPKIGDNKEITSRHKPIEMYWLMLEDLYPHANEDEQSKIISYFKQSTLLWLLQDVGENKFVSQFIDHRDEHKRVYAFMSLIHERYKTLYDEWGYLLDSSEPNEFFMAQSLVKAFYEITVNRKMNIPWAETDLRWVKKLFERKKELKMYSKIEHIFERLDKKLVEELYPPLEVITRKFGGESSDQNWLERYQNGEYEKVWDELVALGDDFGTCVRFEQACQVAIETMDRVRCALIILIDRLKKQGYPLPESIGVKKAKTTEPSDVFAEFLENDFPIPLSLQYFYIVVGEVSFVSDDLSVHPLFNMGLEDLDPLEIYPEDALIDEYGYWQEECEETPAALVGYPMVSLSRDNYHKADISGGPPYSMWIPDASADTEVMHIGMTLVKYLRYAILECGGFPGLDPNENTAVRTFIDELTIGLPQF